jgi:ADP-ribose pyrophosphatase YjhB (NUDIX family)
MCREREVFEECGLIVNDLEFFGISNDMNKPAHFLTVQFKTNNWTGTVENKEPETFEKWEWFDLDALPPNIFIATSNMIHNYKNNIIFYDARW